MRYVSSVLAAVVGIACTVGVTAAADQTILGSSLSVKDPKPGVDPSKRSISVSAKEKASPDTIVGNPALAGSAGGALLEIFAAGDTPSSQTFELAQGISADGKVFWSVTKDGGFKYRDSKGEQGPVKSVDVKRTASGTFTIKAKLQGKGGQIDVVPPNAGTDACVALTLGVGDRYSMQFGVDSTIANSGNRSFKASKPTAQGVCPGVTPPAVVPILPTNTQPCPTIVDGNVTFLGKSVRMWVGPEAATKDGPVVFAWHWLGGNPPLTVSTLLGGAELTEILSMGGIVIGIPSTGPGFAPSDFDVADEALACAHQQFGIDPMRIHSIGMSLGGLQTTAMSTARSNYLASVVAYSGGGYGPDQNPDNKVPALVTHGGPTDIVIVHFDQLTEAYYTEMVSKGRFVIICRHGTGHTVPPGINVGRDWQFLKDHPFGVKPEPYAGGLPAGYPAYCSASQ